MVERINLKRICSGFGFCIWLVMMFVDAAHAYGNQNESFEHKFKIFVEKNVFGGRRINSEYLENAKELGDFYRKRNFAPLWTNSMGLNFTARKAVELLGKSYLHGLQPDEYHALLLKKASDNFAADSGKGKIIDSEKLMEIEVLITDGLYAFGKHLLRGKIEDQNINPGWDSERKRMNVFTLLESFAGQGDEDKFVRELAPRAPEYFRMIKAGEELRKIIENGGWPGFKAGFKKLNPGESDPAVPVIRQRLKVSGEYNSTNRLNANSTAYDPELEQAVKTFQIRHGLEPEGVIGFRTIEELNVSAEKSLRRIEVNLERFRRMPDNWGERYLIVNAPAYTLEAFDSGRKSLMMKVIVGKNFTEIVKDGKRKKQSNKTPVFSETMRYIEINPYWNVPFSIAVDEMLPLVKKDPNYVSANNYEYFSDCRDSNSLTNPLDVQWSELDERSFRGCFRQTPGAWNALGHIKFVFPNNASVYLHDTPRRSLFSRDNRALSHGCVRVEKPMDLALFVLQEDRSWTAEKIQELIAKGKRTSIKLLKPCQVILLYLTAWVDEKGVMQFRKDIYERDYELWTALNQKRRYVAGN